MSIRHIKWRRIQIIKTFKNSNKFLKNLRKIIFFKFKIDERSFKYFEHAKLDRHSYCQKSNENS